MPGPCSLPNGNSRAEWRGMWEMVCDYHGNCTPDNHRVLDVRGDVINHNFITRREWLAMRNKLRTGKS